MQDGGQIAKGRRLFAEPKIRADALDSLRPNAGDRFEVGGVAEDAALIRVGLAVLDDLASGSLTDAGQNQ